MRRTWVSSGRWVILATAFAALAGGLPAAATEPTPHAPPAWGPVQSLGDTGKHAATENEMTGDGTSVIWWPGSKPEGCTHWSAAVRPAGEDGWGEPVELGDKLSRARVVVAGQHSIVAVLESCSGEVTYRRFGADGWSAPRHVPKPGGAGKFDSADVNGHGTLLVTYVGGNIIKAVVHRQHGRWQTLPTVPIGPYDFFLAPDIDADGRVTYVMPERDATWRDIFSIAVYALVDGAWTTERIEPPHGPSFSGTLTSSDDLGAISIAALTREDVDHGAELWVWVRPRGAAEVGAPTELGDPAYDVVGMSGGFDRSGQLVVAWSEDTGEGYIWNPLMAARDPGTGEFSAPRAIAPPTYAGYANADVARDGTVVIEVGLTEANLVYMCDGIRRCSQVGSPRKPPLDTTDFAAGPNRSASVALGDRHCSERGNCWYDDLRAAYLTPRES